MINPLQPFSQVARGVSVRYTATFMIVIVFAVGIACLLLAASVLDALRIVLMVLGSTCILAALAAFGYLLFARPDLLRSESHLQFMKVANWFDDPNLDEEASKRREQVLPLLLGRRHSKTSGPDNSADSDGNHS